MPLLDGELHHRIRIDAPITAPDRYGQMDTTGWTAVTHAWTKRTNPLSATAEALAGGAEHDRQVVRFDLRPRPLQPDWRIVEVASGQVFDIKTIAISNDRSELAVLAVAGLNDG